MHGFWFAGYGWIGMILGLALWILVIGGLIWLVVWAVRRLTGGNSTGHFPVGPASGSQNPKEIAQSRYARGEITREQYQQLLEDLNR